MKQLWKGTCLGVECSIYLDAGKLRVFNTSAYPTPRAIPDYEDIVIRHAFIELAMAMDLGKHEPR